MIRIVGIPAYPGVFCCGTALSACRHRVHAADWLLGTLSLVRAPSWSETQGWPIIVKVMDGSRKIDHWSKSKMEFTSAYTIPGSSGHSSAASKDSSILVFQSKDSLRGHSEGRVRISNPIGIKGRITLLHAMIPNTAPTFDAETFVFHEDGGLSFSITGSFTPTELASRLQEGMRKCSRESGRSINYIVTFSVNTQRLSFSSGDTRHRFSIDPSNFSAGLAYKLGFRPCANPPGDCITAHDPVHLEPPVGCLIEIDNIPAAKKIDQTSGGPIGHFFVPLVQHPHLAASIMPGVDGPLITTAFAEYNGTQGIDFSGGDVSTMMGFRLINPDTHRILGVYRNWVMVLRIDRF